MNIICLGGSAEGLPIIRKVQEMGHRAIVVDGDITAPGFAVGDEVVIASCYHSDDVLRQLQALEIKPDGVICCAIDAPDVADAIAVEFGLPRVCPTPELSKDKQKQLAQLAKWQIPIPRTWWAEHPPELQNVVVKPIDNRGARGVVRVTPYTDYEEAIRNAMQNSPSDTVIIQEWIEGIQLSTESIVRDGKVLFTGIAKRNYDRLDEFAPYVIEDGCDAPWGSPELHQQVSKLIERCCEALGWETLTVKGDLVINDRLELVVIELAARLSGGYLASHTLKWAYGIDIVQYAIEASLGEAYSYHH